MLASDTDPERRQRGLEMVGATANLAGLDAQSIDDLRNKARVLAIQKSPGAAATGDSHPPGTRQTRTRRQRPAALSPAQRDRKQLG